MDELDIAGKQYISTRRAGREHGYHSDYIGQLIRGGKVKGQKVGRSWYVDAESLAIYLGKTVVAAVAQSEAAKTLDTISEEQKKVAEPVVEPAPVEVVAAKIEAPVVEKIVEPIAEVVTKPEEKIVEVKKEIVVAEEPRVVPIQAVRPQAPAPVAVVEEKRENVVGLRYIADDSPSLPKVQTMPEYDAVPMAQAAVTYAPQKRNTVALSLALISAAGLAVVIGVGVSMYVSGAIQVTGETANVYYAIEK